MDDTTCPRWVATGAGCFLRCLRRPRAEHAPGGVASSAFPASSSRLGGRGHRRRVAACLPIEAHDRVANMLSWSYACCDRHFEVKHRTAVRSAVASRSLTIVISGGSGRARPERLPDNHVATCLSCGFLDRLIQRRPWRSLPPTCSDISREPSPSQRAFAAPGSYSNMEMTRITTLVTCFHDHRRAIYPRALSGGIS
jgi:hypothetical protein